jgi:hypothetical protein
VPNQDAAVRDIGNDSRVIAFSDGWRIGWGLLIHIKRGHKSANWTSILASGGNFGLGQGETRNVENVNSVLLRTDLFGRK